MNLRLSIQSSWRLLKGLLRVPLWIPVVLVSACALSKALESGPGVDLSPVKERVTRQEVEAVVGQPEREWVTRAGVRYCLYRYDAGTEPDKGGAGVIVFMDIASLGLFEAFEAAQPEGGGWNIRGVKKEQLLAVSYDAQGVVIGVFKDVGELDSLPEDGRAAEKPAQGADAPDRR